jgi:Fimbrial assembly protein (PilN)
VVAMGRGRILGLSVGPTTIHAVLLWRGIVEWAGEASYDDLSDLADAVARLGAESGRPVTRTRVVLERAVVQLRSIVPAPPLRGDAVRRYVALEAPRLFRKNGAPLVTDARLIPIDQEHKALWTAAVAEPLVQAVLDGAAQAGLVVEAVGPAADVLATALQTPYGSEGGEIGFPNASSLEVLSVGSSGTWRSRLIPLTPSSPSSSEGSARWKPSLAALGPNADHYAAAFAACGRLPRLDLTPARLRAASLRVERRRQLRMIAVAAMLWVLAGGVSAGRLLTALHSSTQFLDSVAKPLDSALAQRRDLDAGRATLETMAAARARRSHQLPLLADLTSALGDSVFLVTLRLGPGTEVHLAGYAPQASRVLRDLERVHALRDPHLEGPVTREDPGGRKPLDRFAIAAHLAEAP